MEKEQLNRENYHSVDARQSFMGYSQFKNFLECEKNAMEIINGNVEEKNTDSLLFGSYVDAYFSKEMDYFVSNHPELFNSKTGELKKTFSGANKVIESIESDEKMMQYLNGEHQVIMTGIIAGVPFKIRIDSYHPGKAIVDQKVMKDVEPVWIELEDDFGKYNKKVNFVEKYRYDLEGAIYQEVVRQNTGDKLPFILAITTKEEIPVNYLAKIDQSDLDIALQEVIEKAPRYYAIKQGKIKPNSCGNCNSCRKEKKVTGVFSYHIFDPTKKEKL